MNQKSHHNLSTRSARTRSPIIPPGSAALMRILPIFLILIAMLTDIASAQQVSRSIDRDTIRTGDLFTYQIHISVTEEYDEILYPDSTDFGPDFVIRNKTVRSDPYGDSLTYTLQYFGIDDQPIPELYAGFIDGADTTFLVIPEQSFIYQGRVDDEESALRPLKPIFPFFRDWWPWILAAVVILSVVCFLLYRFRDRFFPAVRPSEKPEFEPSPFRNPLDTLQEELGRIEDVYPDPHKSYRSFYTELGDVFRAYFEHAYRFPALESTSGEVIEELKRRQCDDEVIRLLATILQEADLVKFAKYWPNESDCQDVMKKSSLLVARIAETDKPIIEALRQRHEERQKMEQEKFSEETHYGLG